MVSRSAPTSCAPILPQNNFCMSSIFQNKRVLILIGGFVLATALLLVFGAGGSEPNVSNGPISPYLSVAPAPSVGGPTSAALGEDLLTALALLKTISLDTSVFTDPVFLSLSDWGKAIPPQPAGRRNPFAPLGAPTSSNKTTSAPSVPAAPAPPVTPPASQTAGAGAAIPPASAEPLGPDESVWDFSDIDFAL